MIAINGTLRNTSIYFTTKWQKSASSVENVGQELRFAMPNGIIGMAKGLFRWRTCPVLQQHIVCAAFYDAHRGHERKPRFLA